MINWRERTEHIEKVCSKILDINEPDKKTIKKICKQNNVKYSFIEKLLRLNYTESKLEKIEKYYTIIKELEDKIAKSKESLNMLEYTLDTYRNNMKYLVENND